ncbi:hypothetical protein DMH20_26180 [Escherichia coli]|nr:hypothetical protein [Escherichia coli]
MQAGPVDAHVQSIFTYFSTAAFSHIADPGFASGLPLALTSGTLQARMTVENIDLKTIGFFSLVGRAYVLNSSGHH